MAFLSVHPEESIKYTFKAWLTAGINLGTLFLSLGGNKSFYNNKLVIFTNLYSTKAGLSFKVYTHDLNELPFLLPPSTCN